MSKLKDTFTPSRGNSDDFRECARLQVEQVRLLDRFSNKSTHGTLYLTATHLIFVESSSNNTPAGAQEIWVSTWLRTATSLTSLFDSFIWYQRALGWNTLQSYWALWKCLFCITWLLLSFHVLLKKSELCKELYCKIIEDKRNSTNLMLPSCTFNSYKYIQYI